MLRDASDRSGRPKLQRLGQRGFTLIEIMVSMTVIGFGMVALAGLMVRSMQAADIANYRTQATAMAYVMGDAMRSNIQGVVQSYYNGVDTVAATNPGCASSGCTVATEAQLDVYQWKQQIEDQLPGGIGVVCLDSTPDDGTDDADPQCDGAGSAYAIKVFWREARSANAARQRFSVAFRP